MKLRDGIYTKQQGNVLTGRAIRHRGVSKDKGCYGRVVIFGKNSQTVDRGKLAGILDPKSQEVTFATQGLAVPRPHPSGTGWGQPGATEGHAQVPQPCSHGPSSRALRDGNRNQGEDGAAYISVERPCSGHDGQPHGRGIIPVQSVLLCLFTVNAAFPLGCKPPWF